MFLMVKKFGIQNTSFKRLKTRGIFNRLQSEDLPHKSGIKTNLLACVLVPISRKTCPTNRGLRQTFSFLYYRFNRRKTCPTNRGLRRRNLKEIEMLVRRKTCPTNRGLRPRNGIWFHCVGRLASKINNRNSNSFG